MTRAEHLAGLVDGVPPELAEHAAMRHAQRYKRDAMRARGAHALDVARHIHRIVPGCGDRQLALQSTAGVLLAYADAIVADERAAIRSEAFAAAKVAVLRELRGAMEREISIAGEAVERLKEST